MGVGGGEGEARGGPPGQGNTANLRRAQVVTDMGVSQALGRKRGVRAGGYLWGDIMGDPPQGGNPSDDGVGGAYWGGRVTVVPPGWERDTCRCGAYPYGPIVEGACPPLIF